MKENEFSYCGLQTLISWTLGLLGEFGKTTQTKPQRTRDSRKEMRRMIIFLIARK